MTIQDTSPHPTIAIVACQHGNELFGKEIVDAILETPEQFPGVRTVIANELAIERGVRFVDEDLNRAFPGNDDTHEGRLAKEVLQAVKGCDVVLDIHTTFADLTFIPIVTSITPDVQAVLRSMTSDNLMYVQKPYGTGALVSHVRGGISPEYGRKYANTPQAVKEVLETITNIIAGNVVQEKIENMFYVDSVISMDVDLEEGAQNFVYDRNIDGYPCLLKEKAYEAAAYQCLKASKVEPLELSS